MYNIFTVDSLSKGYKVHEKDDTLDKCIHKDGKTSKPKGNEHYPVGRCL